MDETVKRLIRARDNRSVLKIKLLNLDAQIKDEPIFVFEGRDDREVYSVWLRRTKEDLRYEPFSCGNKKKVLTLFDIASRDRGDLKNRVFFFVDRDFDDLQGREPNPVIFMTDRYAIENYLVDSATLEDLLKVEFHCDGMPDVRGKVLTIFEKAYSEFLLSTKNVNERLFIARRLGVETKPLPDSLNVLAKVAVTEVAESEKSAEEIVVLEVDPAPEALAPLREEFRELNGAARYRGKFALMFFKRWLELLSDERRAETSDLFPSRCHHKIKNDFPVSLLAIRCPIPLGLGEFVTKAA